ncbi:MAG: helix-turn-helix transcriptional regulator [Ruminococcus sp.]|nr:helix-turn-helix transcriptional regulator [Ruminococcus sp.]
MRIKEIREIKGMSQQELADKVGISIRTMKRYENGETKPDVNKMFQIAEALEVQLTELLSEESALETGNETSSSAGKSQAGQARGNSERKMCPYRKFTRKSPDGYTAERFSECLYKSCMMYDSLYGTCRMCKSGE